MDLILRKGRRKVLRLKDWWQTRLTLLLGGGHALDTNAKKLRYSCTNFERNLGGKKVDETCLTN